MQDAKRIARALHRLLATFPTFASGDGRTALEVYYEVASQHDDEDVERVVERFILGLVEGQSLTYLPTAAMFASQLRTAKADRMSADAWRQRGLAQIEEREAAEAAREPRESRMQAVERHMARMPPVEGMDAETQAIRARLLRAHDAKFHPEPTDEA